MTRLIVCMEDRCLHLYASTLDQCPYCGTPKPEKTYVIDHGKIADALLKEMNHASERR